MTVAPLRMNLIHSAGVIVCAPLLFSSPLRAMDARADAPAPTTSAEIDCFAPAFARATLIRQEPDAEYHSQVGEPAFPALMDLKEGERLVRRTGIFLLSNGEDQQRLDRIYRLKIGDDEANKYAAPRDTPGAVAVLDAGGGELVWANAMAANRVTVLLKEGASAEQLLGSLSTRFPASVQKLSEQVILLTTQAKTLPRLEDWLAACNSATDLVDFAEPDFSITALAQKPNDCCYTDDVTKTDKQWYLPKINAPLGWDTAKDTKDQTPGSTDYYIIAVLDTGVNAAHPELANNLVAGKSFVDATTNDDDGHGTQVAGVIGAVGNNTHGVTGVAWSTKMMPLRVLKHSDNGIIGSASIIQTAMNWLRTQQALNPKIVVAHHSWGMKAWDRNIFNTLNLTANLAVTAQPANVTGKFAANSNEVTLTGTTTDIGNILPGMLITGPATTCLDPMVMYVDYPHKKLYLVTPTVTPTGTNPPAPGTLVFAPTRAYHHAYGIVNVVAADNQGRDADRAPVFPACFPSKIMISVGASGTDDKYLTSATTGAIPSNFGLHTINLFAPGFKILTTHYKIAQTCCPTDTPSTTDLSISGYITTGGTCFAAAQVSAAVAIYRSRHPAMIEVDVRDTLLNHSAKVGNLGTACTSGGRLDLQWFFTATGP